MNFLKRSLVIFLNKEESIHFIVSFSESICAQSYDYTIIHNTQCLNRVKCMYRRHWSSNYGSGACDFGRARQYPLIHHRDAHGIRNI